MLNLTLLDLLVLNLTLLDLLVLCFNRFGLTSVVLDLAGSLAGQVAFQLAG